jgi:probable HAF family extracellular repeat protein
MKKKIFHALAILAFAIFVGHGPRLMAQTDSSGGSSGPNMRRDLPHWLKPFMEAGAAASQTAGVPEDAVEMGLAKKKTYQFRTVDYPAAITSLTLDYNDGIAGGYFQFYELGSQAFYFNGSANSLLNIPGATASMIEGINGSGHMAGLYFDSNSVAHGFVSKGKSVTTVDVPAAAGWTEASDISDSGVIVGNYIDRKGIEHGFEDNNGSFSAIDYPGAQSTYADGINASGEIVGIYYDSSGYVHGFLLKHQTYTSIDFPSARNTHSFGINDAGDIAGTFQYSDGVRHGFTYSNGVFSQVDVDQAAGTVLFRIKNNGNVVGWLLDGLYAAHGIIGK